MDYARFGDDSDVFMLQTLGGYIECSSCKMSKKKPIKHPNGKTSWVRQDQIFTKRSEALKHLLSHHIKGHKVPNYAIKRLQDEIKSVGDIIC